MGGERQLAHAKNSLDARAFGVRLSSETDSPLSHPSALSKTKRIAIYWVSLNSYTLFESALIRVNACQIPDMSSIWGDSGLAVARFSF
jgi:hypothetical protein